MRIAFLFFFLSLFLAVPVYSQNSFIKQYGGVNLNDQGVGWDIATTYDSSYILFASYYDGVSSTLQIVKTDTSGNLIWGKKIAPNSSSYHLSATAMLPTSDSGFILTGRENYANDDFNIYYLKIDKNGNLQWSKFLDNATLHDYGEKVIETTDGGYLVVGSFYNDPIPNTGSYLIKTDAMGNLVWTQLYAGGQWAGYLNVEQNPDNSFTMIGENYAGVSIMHLDINGNALSSRQIDLPMEVTSALSQKTSDGGHLIVGQIDSTQLSTYKDFYMMKVDSTDSVLWCKKFSTTTWDMPFSLRPTSDGGYVFTVYSNGGGINTSFIFKLDAAGDTLWTTGFDDIALYSVTEDYSGNYVATGRIDGLQPVQATIVKVDSSGSTTCPVSSFQYQMSSMNYQYINVVLGSNSPSFNTFNVPLTVSSFSIQSDYCIPASITEERKNSETISARFNGNVLEITYQSFTNSKITINVSDISGSRLITKEAECYLGINIFNLETELAKGIYLVTLSSSTSRLSLKVIQTN